MSPRMSSEKLQWLMWTHSGQCHDWASGNNQANEIDKA